MEQPSNEKPTVMVLGDRESAEFIATAELLARRACLVSWGETTAALKLVVYCQSRPGEIKQALVEEVYQQHPYVLQLIVLGSWCEGEMRTGTPLQNVERVFWYNAMARIERLLSKKTSAAFVRVEALNDAIDRSLRRLECKTELGEAAIFATSHDDYQCGADLCSAAGYVPCWLPRLEQLESKPRLFIWNADNTESPQLRQQLRTAAANYPQALRMVLANFPRYRTVQLALANGATHVFGKPFLLADIISAIELFATHHERLGGNPPSGTVVPPRHSRPGSSTLRVTA